MATRYTRTTLNGRPIDMHRKVVQAAIGRPLRADEYVHHKNENKRDNSLLNLEVVDPVTHGRMHHLIHPLAKACNQCGKTFEPHKTKRKRAKFCSSECVSAYQTAHLHNRKLTQSDRDVIQARRRAGESLKAIACDFGVSITTVSEVARMVGAYAAK